MLRSIYWVLVVEDQIRHRLFKSLTRPYAQVNTMHNFNYMYDRY
jgi:hypothetical protein